MTAVWQPGHYARAVFFIKTRFAVWFAFDGGVFKSLLIFFITLFPFFITFMRPLKMVLPMYTTFPRTYSDPSLFDYPSLDHPFDRNLYSSGPLLYS